MSFSQRVENFNPAMSLSQRVENSNQSIKFEPASASTLRQKGVPEWRHYNRLLTAKYESVVIERDALKKKSTRLERDVRELEAALDASDQSAVSRTDSSEDVRVAHAKIAGLESALVEAHAASKASEAASSQLTLELEHSRADLQNAFTEITTLRSALEAANQGSTDDRGSSKSITQAMSLSRGEVKPAEAAFSATSPLREYHGPPPPSSESSDESEFGSELSDFEEGRGPFDPYAPIIESPGGSSQASSSPRGQPSSSIGNSHSRILTPSIDRQVAPSRTECISPIPEVRKRDSSQAGLESELDADPRTPIPNLFSVKSSFDVERKKRRVHLHGEDA
ncbi:MAG: hypothetical protein L6R42_000576 [Xanthoria sp. 1 TBL-2021]|nr:MAG: hypothetical protein L6R42_000576 [Xanthoria sp. 1 TBL-2021]